MCCRCCRRTSRSKFAVEFGCSTLTLHSHSRSDQYLRIGRSASQCMCTFHHDSFTTVKLDFGRKVHARHNLPGTSQKGCTSCALFEAHILGASARIPFLVRALLGRNRTAAHIKVRPVLEMTLGCSKLYFAPLPLKIDVWRSTVPEELSPR